VFKKEVQNSFWQGSGGVPQYKFPHDWGIKGVENDKWGNNFFQTTIRIVEIGVILT
jgi:hypothetical protein